MDRAPTVAELADAIGCCDERVLEALQARRSRDAASLSAPTSLGDDQASELQDILGSIEAGYACAEARVELERLLRFTAPRARLALRLRFERDLTQSEIGALLGVSQMQVSRIIRTAIEQLGDIAADEQARAERRPIAA